MHRSILYEGKSLLALSFFLPSVCTIFKAMQLLKLSDFIKADGSQLKKEGVGESPCDK